MLSAIGNRARAWVATSDPFTNVYGVARSILAVSGVLTLWLSGTDALFRPVVGIPDFPICTGVRAAGIYCLGAPHLTLMRWVSILVCLIVATGWRPRFTGVVHAYVAFSLQANAVSIEGGDQVIAILTLLLVPVTLLDDRRWHWSSPVERPLDRREEARRLVAKSCFSLIRLQVCGIYFHAAVGKLAVAEWTDGTALYYWFLHPTFGAPSWLMPVLKVIVLNGTVLTLVTWGVLVVEYALSCGLLMAKRYWAILLVLGIALHAGIAVIHGLVSFSITMMAALVLYLRPIDRQPA